MLIKRLFEDIFDDIDDELLQDSSDELENIHNESKYNESDGYEHRFVVFVNGIKRSKKREVNIENARRFVRIFRYHLSNMAFVDDFSDVIMCPTYDPSYKLTKETEDDIKDLNGGLYVKASSVCIKTELFDSPEVKFEFGINTHNALNTPHQVGTFYTTLVKCVKQALVKSYGNNKAIFSYFYDKYTDSEGAIHSIYMSKKDYEIIMDKQIACLPDFYRICRMFNPQADKKKCVEFIIRNTDTDFYNIRTYAELDNVNAHIETDEANKTIIIHFNGSFIKWHPKKKNFLKKLDQKIQNLGLKLKVSLNGKYNDVSFDINDMEDIDIIRKWFSSYTINSRIYLYFLAEDPVWDGIECIDMSNLNFQDDGCIISDIRYKKGESRYTYLYGEKQQKQIEHKIPYLKLNDQKHWICGSKKFINVS